MDGIRNKSFNVTPILRIVTVLIAMGQRLEICGLNLVELERAITNKPASVESTFEVDRLGSSATRLYYRLLWQSNAFFVKVMSSVDGLLADAPYDPNRSAAGAYNESSWVLHRDLAYWWPMRKGWMDKTSLTDVYTLIQWGIPCQITGLTTVQDDRLLIPTACGVFAIKRVPTNGNRFELRKSGDESYVKELSYATDSGGITEGWNITITCQTRDARRPEWRTSVLSWKTNEYFLPAQRFEVTNILNQDVRGIFFHGNQTPTFVQNASFIEDPAWRRLYMRNLNLRWAAYTWAALWTISMGYLFVRYKANNVS
jgi:hypothetical protein